MESLYYHTTLNTRMRIRDILRIREVGCAKNAVAHMIYQL